MSTLPAGVRPPEERRILTMVRWLLYLVFIAIAYVTISELAPVLAPILAAAGVAYLLNGPVDYLEDRRVPRAFAVGLLLVLFIGGSVALILFVAPLLLDEAMRFVRALPDVLKSFSGWLAGYGIYLPSDWHDVSKRIPDLLERAAQPISQVAVQAVGGVFTFIAYAAEMLIIPVFAFYFLVDWHRMLARCREFVPLRHRKELFGLAEEIDRVISIWIRRQFTVVMILTVLYSISFRIIGVPFGLTLGVVVGLLPIIPFLGTVVGAGLTALVLVFEWQGWGVFLATGAVFLVLHLLEAAVLTPKIVGKKIGLGEVGALFAVIAGGKLLGFVGVLLAVPLAASVAVLIRRLLRYYEESEFYRAERAATQPPRASDEGPGRKGETPGRS
jgi:predicted PurR-regulated permease PerM